MWRTTHITFPFLLYSKKSHYDLYWSLQSRGQSSRHRYMHRVEWVRCKCAFDYLNNLLECWMNYRCLMTVLYSIDNRQRCQRQILLQSGILTLCFRYDNLEHPPYGWRLGYSPQGTWNKTLGHRGGDSWLVWLGTTSASDICSLVRWSGFSYSRGLMVQPYGGGWPLTTLDRRAGCCWRRGEVWPELRPDGH